MMQIRQFFAMGSHMTVWLESDTAVLDEVEGRFFSAEKRFSRFLPDSELTQLNQRSTDEVAISAEMSAMLSRALQLAEATDGLFDPTILPALEAAGYTRSFELLDAASAPPHTLHSFNYRAIEMDRSRCAVRLPGGLRIDLGGIAKGYTAQQVVDWLSRFGPCLLDAGGDLVAGDAPSGSPGWPVGISAPWQGDDEQDNLLRLWLSNATLATSGVDYRQWQRDGRQMHHIIDPTTGDSAETDLLTASVIAADASTAEAWATAALVAGRDRAAHILTRHNLKAALIDRDHSAVLTPALQPLVEWEC
ncbi:MAG: FAD:protein FMN transferase [Anaerolineae bacterium]|nr:FAD:protein FMN transferase [Anaerolineae bacterium]